MKSAAVVALALLESVQAFQAPAAMKASRSAAVTMFSEGDIGVLPPLGVFDPLGLIETRNMARYEVRRRPVPSRGAAAQSRGARGGGMKIFPCSSAERVARAQSAAASCTGRL